MNTIILEIIKKSKATFSLLLIMWLIEVVELFFSLSFNYTFGLIPRQLNSFLNIFSMPFVHSDFAHLISNTIPFLVFSILVLMHERVLRYFSIILSITIITGIMLWLFGRTSIHIGASGVVFGLFGYLISTSIFRRNVLDIIIAITLIIFYGGILYGILPIHQGVSWEGHLFGLIAGILTSFILHKKLKEPLNYKRV